MKPPTIISIRPADENHQVVSVEGGGARYMRKPCPECPWRRAAPIGAFPAEAYRISAKTAYDMSLHKFSCHMAGAEKPATCAGFLLRGADHNLSVRLARCSGSLKPDDVTTEVDLYDSYRDMAEANGVASDDPALARCR
ncbi:DUF6283 family protein [Nitrospirillum amazonense]|uniref:DUF6283 family protein n=1 Tax=Nitrospirillum amazonense TaxID=28077 RepID=UPI002412456B|nr:DUF6283 family protein [Nitrospirillum amazonense]MDG3444636.1 DUF6283 family protein [Nitrospirillum amazonense]